MQIATRNLAAGELAEARGLILINLEASAASPQSRYVGAMEVAAALALEMALVAKAAAELARADWVNRRVMCWLSDDVTTASTRTLQAAMFAKKIAESDCV